MPIFFYGMAYPPSTANPPPLGSVLRHASMKNIHVSGEDQQEHVSKLQADLVRQSLSPVRPPPF